MVGFCTLLFPGLWLRYFSRRYLGHFKHFGHHHNSTRILLPNHQPKVINSSLSWPWNHGKIYKKSKYFCIRCNIVYSLVYEENIWEDFTYNLRKYIFSGWITKAKNITIYASNINFIPLMKSPQSTPNTNRNVFRFAWLTHCSNISRKLLVALKQTKKSK